MRERECHFLFSLVFRHLFFHVLTQIIIFFYYRSKKYSTFFGRKIETIASECLHIMIVRSTRKYVLSKDTISKNHCKLQLLLVSRFKTTKIAMHRNKLIHCIFGVFFLHCELTYHLTGKCCFTFLYICIFLSQIECSEAFLYINLTKVELI